MLFEDNTIYIFMKILTIILGTLSMTAVLLHLRFGLKKTILSLSVYLAYAITVSLFIYRIWDFHTLAYMSLFTISLPGIVVLYYIFAEPPMRLVFIGVSTILFSIYMTGCATLLNKFFHGNELSDMILRVSMYVLCILLESLLLRRSFLYAEDIITTNWGILSLIPCSLTVFVLVLAQYPQNYTQNPNITVPFIFIGVVIVILYFAIFQYLRTQFQYQMKEQNWEILQLQIQNIRQNTADINKRVEAAKMARQDTYNLMSGIATLAKDKNWEAILDIVNRETVKNNAPASVDYCSDPIVNATLNSYLGKAQNAGITLDTHLLLPKILPVDSAEFSLCLANALDNAIKACKKLPKNKRMIIFKCTCQPKLMFRIENTCTGKIHFTRNGIPISSAAGHGIGTRSIMAFCEKNNAVYAFKVKDGWFKIMVSL